MSKGQQGLNWFSLIAFLIGLGFFLVSMGGSFGHPML
jgi:hypothetical protein